MASKKVGKKAADRGGADRTEAAKKKVAYQAGKALGSAQSSMNKSSSPSASTRRTTAVKRLEKTPYSASGSAVRGYMAGLYPGKGRGKKGAR